MGKLDFSTLFSDHYFPLLVTGLLMTLLLFALAWCLAMALGLLLAVTRMLPFRPLRFVAALFVEYQRNVPLLVHLLVWYFGVPQLLPWRVNGWLNDHNAEFLFAVVAIGCYNSAYISEYLRSGLRAIPKVQFEASRSVGFGFFGALWWVILPQAWRNALPGLVNQSLIIFKGTSLGAVIGVTELTYQARLIESETYRVFETFIVISLVYLAGTLPLMALGAKVQRRGGASARGQ
ncbi:MAG: amino acid ABC transporter permease [Rhodobacteraceae bacterium]|nr:amino acid ABC transporter permease [Paracoccaceae bacterium]